MDVKLAEDDTTKQFMLSKDRAIVDEGNHLAELRILSKDRQYIAQIHPEHFESWRKFLEMELHDEQYDVNLGIKTTTVSGTCAFCEEENKLAFNMPVSLNLSQEGVYPAIAGGEYTVRMCKTCAKEVHETVVDILESRTDLLLAHEI